MSLQDYEDTLLRCVRCSECKWIPLPVIKSWRFAQGCPSVGRFNFHAYSAGGRLIMGLSVHSERLDYTEEYLDILYRCQMCGACDVSCKCNKDIEPLAVTQELRAKAVADGELLPAHMVTIDGLRKDDNMMLGKKGDRGNWASGLGVKNLSTEKAAVYFHAGCRYAYDEQLWPVVRSAVEVLQEAGVDIGIAGQEENCCGGRAYELGYVGEAIKYAETNREMLKAAGVTTVVTACADCYHAFKVRHSQLTGTSGVEVLHITEFLEKLISAGSLKLKRSVPLKVTYHDPCHLGRLAEPYIAWQGEKKSVFQQSYRHDPPKPLRKGTGGVYQPPREVLAAIPGLRLVEMERTREYAWCCGASGGVKEAYPDFALWTAAERIEEAKATGAEALVTACPWCKNNFTDALAESGDGLRVLDIVELVRQALQERLDHGTG